MSSDFNIARLVLGEQQGLCKIFTAPRSETDPLKRREDGPVRSGIETTEVTPPERQKESDPALRERADSSVHHDQTKR